MSRGMPTLICDFVIDVMSTLFAPAIMVLVTDTRVDVAAFRKLIDMFVRGSLPSYRLSNFLRQWLNT